MQLSEPPTKTASVWLANTVPHQAMFALGAVMTIFSLATLGLYALKPAPD